MISNSPKPLHTNDNPNEKQKGHSSLNTYDQILPHDISFNLHDNLQGSISKTIRGSKEASTMDSRAHGIFPLHQLQKGLNTQFLQWNQPKFMVPNFILSK